MDLVNSAALYSKNILNVQYNFLRMPCIINHLQVGGELGPKILKKARIDKNGYEERQLTVFRSSPHIS